MTRLRIAATVVMHSLRDITYGKGNHHVRIKIILAFTVKGVRVLLPVYPGTI